MVVRTPETLEALLDILRQSGPARTLMGGLTPGMIFDAITNRWPALTGTE